MNFGEEALRFACEGETLFGIIARPETPFELGVVIVVGGPQTRVGSHRQFVLLSRVLAAAGFPVLRFDVRGMGDSSGEQRNFEQITPDIAAAVDMLQTACPAVKRIVLWGLCDAASAALLYVDATHDPRLAGLILLNPWVRSEASLARTQVKHYYGRRLLEAEFWRKLLFGRLNIAHAVGEFFQKLHQTKTAEAASLGFQRRMARGWREFSGPILLILSGDDYTAKEFLDTAQNDPAWSGLLARENVERHDHPQADHTFSSQQWRQFVENICLDWLKKHA